jgi:hypothetical protein
MTDDRYHVEIDFPDIIEFRIGETFDLSQRMLNFIKVNNDKQTKELMLEILDHINGLYQTQNLMLQEYNKMLSEWSRLLEDLNGNGGTNPNKVQKHTQ